MGSTPSYGYRTGIQKWSEELDHVKKLEYPRYAKVTPSENLELHVFGDSSKRAYATVAFSRSVQDGVVHVSLLAAKTRVTPLKSITIPRLELLACLLRARLTTSIVRALARQINTIIWSDSSTALSWISQKHECSIFVSNRVKEIRSSTNIDDWKFVPGTLNPADLPSKYCYAPQFILSEWWEGLQWLRESEDKWPKQKPIPNEEQVLKEKKEREEIQGKTLSTHEVVQAEKVLIRLIQRDSLGKGQISHLKTKLETSICHVEAIINTRPLTYISETEDDLIPITPQIFIQNNFGSFDESHELSPDNTRQHFRKLQQTKKKRRKDSTRNTSQCSFKRGMKQRVEGQVVLTGRDGQKRIFWPLGRILELYPGKDGRERIARVRTATGEFVRPLKRLFSLELGSDISREVRLPKSEGIKTQEIPTGGEQSIFTRSGREVKKPTRLGVHTNDLS
ncbi:hypothetical protein LAZ67_19001743 [Cordylochernes scorpioides]|uniref:DUF5641 domain-containing protein n=1 Tax=Cordylochernes scorpioides TaxID=51811 RepID=A0ABY6LLS1_9ARAC|nr:hypothetical protein LAZ67_19001743 [Cordylochernes scorpioides]